MCSLETPPTTQVAEFQHAEVLVATADTTQSLDASELVEEQANQLKPDDDEKVQEQNVEKEVKSYGLNSIGDVTFEHATDEYEKKQSDDVERSESPYDTKSEIKVVKRFQPTQTDDEDHITFLGLVYEDMKTDLDKADSDLHLLPDDEVESVSGFEAAESSANEYVKAGSKVKLTQSEEAFADNLLDEMTNLNASADKRSYPFGPLLAKFSYISTKVANLESSLAQKVTAKLEEYVPRMVADAFEERMPKVQETLHIIVPDLIRKPLNKELNALNTLETQRFENLPKELLSAIRGKVGKFVRKYVEKEMQIVKDRLSYSAEKLDKGDVNLCVLINLMKDIVLLLDSSNVFKKAKAEGEKVSLEKDMALELAEEAKAKAAKEAKANTQGSLNQLTRQVLKKLRKSFRRKTIRGLTPIQKAKQPAIVNMTVGQFTDSLFNTTSSEYSPTPPKDESKGKGITTEDNPMKELIPLMDEGGLSPTMQNIRQLTKKEESEKVLKKTSAGIEGLTECKASVSNLRRIQVKDIVKEVKDYLKTYSSAGMDISWYVEGIRYGFKDTQRWQYSDYLEGQGRRGSGQGMKVEVDQGYPRAGRLRKGVASDVVGSINALGGSASLHGGSANLLGRSGSGFGGSVIGLGGYANGLGRSANDVGVSAIYVGVSVSSMGRHINHKGGYVGVSSSGMGRSGKGVSTSDVGGSTSGMEGSGNVNIGTGRAGISSDGVRGFDIPGLRNNDTGSVSYDMDAVNEGNQDASQANPSIQASQTEVENPTQDEILSQVTNDVPTEVQMSIASRKRSPSYRIIKRNLAKKGSW
ncbi:hypothetical protein Tco_0855936 [Tanacetum coccineum]